MCSTNAYDSRTNACNVSELPGMTVLTAFITNLTYLNKTLNSQTINALYGHLYRNKSMPKHSEWVHSKRSTCLQCGIFLFPLITRVPFNLGEVSAGTRSYKELAVYKLTRVNNCSKS